MKKAHCDHCCKLIEFMETDGRLYLRGHRDHFGEHCEGSLMVLPILPQREALPLPSLVPNPDICSQAEVITQQRTDDLISMQGLLAKEGESATQDAIAGDAMPVVLGAAKSMGLMLRAESKPGSYAQGWADCIAYIAARCPGIDAVMRD